MLVAEEDQEVGVALEDQAVPVAKVLLVAEVDQVAGADLVAEEGQEALVAQEAKVASITHMLIKGSTRANHKKVAKADQELAKGKDQQLDQDKAQAKAMGTNQPLLATWENTIMHKDQLVMATQRCLTSQCKRSWVRLEAVFQALTCLKPHARLVTLTILPRSLDHRV